MKHRFGDEAQLASAYQALGQARWYLAGPGAALSPFRKGRRLLESLAPAESKLLANMLDNEALCLQGLGRLKTAAATQQRALAIVDSLKLTAQARKIRRRLSNVLQDMGLFAAAEEMLRDCRPPPRASAEEWVGWLHSHALLFERWNRLAEAEEWYDRTTQLFERRAAECPMQLACVLNAALLKLDNKAIAQARRLLDVAVALQPTHPPAGYVVTRELAEAVFALRSGDVEAATAAMHRARAEVAGRYPGNKGYELGIVGYHADLLRHAGYEDQALTLLLVVLEAESVRFRIDGHRFLHKLGVEGLAFALPLVELLLTRNGDPARARPLLRSIFAGPPADGEGERRCLAAMAELASLAGRTDQAILFGKLAAARMLRSVEEFPTSAYQRDAVIADREQPFLKLVQRLIRAGRITEAGRIRALLIQQRASNLTGKGVGAQSSGLEDVLGDSELAELLRYEAIRSRIRQAAEHLSAAPSAARVGEDQRRSFAAARRSLQNLFDRATDPAFASSTRSPPAASRADATAIATDVARLRYLIGDDRVVVEVVAKGATMSTRLAASADSVAQHLFAFIGRLRAGAEWIEEAQVLYHHLVAPIEPLLNDVSKLQIAADGPLESMPFAALHDGSRCLVERFDIQYVSGSPATSASGTAKRSIAAFGVSRAWQDLPALSGVREELGNAVSGASGAVRYLDRRFTAGTLQGALNDKFSRIHIASHYHLVPGSPKRSFLLLGDGTRLSVSAFLSERFDWSATDLLFLSACETATGDTKFDAGGTLAAALHQRGLRNLIATLWPIADISTAALVGRFYTALRTRADPAAALRDAQIAVLRRSVPGMSGADEATALPRTKPVHPYHWAAFKLFIPGV